MDWLDIDIFNGERKLGKLIFSAVIMIETDNKINFNSL
jgi:hypothetical protein